MKVIPVPCRADNYMYILVDENSGATAVVDPYDVVKLETAAKENALLDRLPGATLLLTHHHEDHSGGNKDFIAKYPGGKVYAGSNTTKGVTDLLKHNDEFKLGMLAVKAVATPCHTQDSISYYVEDTAKSQRGVFTGDTLFVGGSGRFFEGTGEEMNEALNVRLASLPDDTTTYVGHEYTASNVAFGKSIDGTDSNILKLVEFARKNEVTTGKFTIGDERRHNVFLRLNSKAVRKATGAMVIEEEGKPEVVSMTEGEIMTRLRELKNNFKG